MYAACRRAQRQRADTVVASPDLAIEPDGRRGARTWRGWCRQAGRFIAVPPDRHRSRSVRGRRPVARALPVWAFDLGLGDAWA